MFRGQCHSLRPSFKLARNSVLVRLLVCFFSAKVNRWRGMDKVQKD